MYVPEHFAASPDQVQALLTSGVAGDLITATDEGLDATFLPFVFDPTTGEHGALLGHVARVNDQWRRQPRGDALVILRGPDAYITPGWYPSKIEHGRVVPTWNYVTVHVHGRLVVHDDTKWVDGLVRRLTDQHESHRDSPWSVADAPLDYITGQLRAIVGVEIVITHVEAKAKLSQNRPDADVDGVVAGLEAAGDMPSARAVEEARRGGD